MALVGVKLIWLRGRGWSTSTDGFRVAWRGWGRTGDGPGVLGLARGVVPMSGLEWIEGVLGIELM